MSEREVVVPPCCRALRCSQPPIPNLPDFWDFRQSLSTMAVDPGIIIEMMGSTVPMICLLADRFSPSLWVCRSAVVQIYAASRSEDYSPPAGIRPQTPPAESQDKLPSSLPHHSSYTYSVLPASSERSDTLSGCQPCIEYYSCSP